MRTIDADKIVYESIDSSDTAREEMYYGHGILAVRKEDIDAMPTVEPERKKGKWIKRNSYDRRDNFYARSECGRSAAGYIKIADNCFIQVKRKPIMLHRFMMRMFFGWKWVKDWHNKTEE